MNVLNLSFVAMVVSALCAAAPAVSQAEPAAKLVPDYTVFLDPPTGFVFVKLPAGWKFVGKVEVKDLARIPDGVVTALLTDDDDTDETRRVALRPAK